MEENNMNETLFWSALSAIGTTVGAFATTAAVIVALWQSQLPYKRKVKIHFSDNSMIKATRESELEHIVTFSISNIGNRDITLEGLLIQIQDSSSIVLLPQFLKYETIQFPYLLSTDKSATVVMQYTQFCECLSDIVRKDKNALNKKISIVFSDNTNRKYILKLKATPQKYLK